MKGVPTEITFIGGSVSGLTGAFGGRSRALYSDASRPPGGDHYRIVDVRFKTKYLTVLERPHVNRGYFEFLPGRPSNSRV